MPNFFELVSNISIKSILEHALTVDLKTLNDQRTLTANVSDKTLTLFFERFATDKALRK